MKYLYKYPQQAYPYAELVGVNRSRSRRELEYEQIRAPRAAPPGADLSEERT